jgi:hypothetical protein
MAEGVIVVLARAGDPALLALERHASAACIAQLTPRDLARPGWRYVAGSPQQFVAVTSIGCIPAGDIAAVVTRFTHVVEADLGHIVAADRAYVAAEVQAFLLGALTPLSCPMFNRPTATSLSGPYWRNEQWVFAAARSGMAVRPSVRHCRLGPMPSGVVRVDGERTSVSVIGNECLGAVNAQLRHQARQLARRAGVSLLEVRFERHEHDWYFDGASVTPEINAEVATTLLACVEGPGLRRMQA